MRASASQRPCGVTIGPAGHPPRSPAAGPADAARERGAGSGALGRGICGLRGRRAAAARAARLAQLAQLGLLGRHGRVDQLAGVRRGGLGGALGRRLLVLLQRLRAARVRPLGNPGKP